MAKTRSRAIDLCLGSYIAILDSDDLAEENRIELQLKKIKLSNSDVCIGGVEFFGEGISRAWYPSIEDGEVEILLAFNCAICNSSALVKKDAIVQVGNYDSESLTEDYNLWVKFLKAGLKFTSIENVVVKSRQHNNSYTRSKRNMILDSATIDRENAIRFLYDKNPAVLPELLSRGLSGSNKLKLREFVTFCRLYEDLNATLAGLSKESKDFIVHNWISIGINNMHTGIIGFFYWIQVKTVTDFINFPLKCKMFFCYLFKLTPGGFVYNYLKKIVGN
ncbi:glycosyltransferase [Vibrio mimicus]|uniref:glycosyltransferase n=1 Tax=Vibrio mimicus TaxID=674 RepID=UPI002351E141|nr:glycosyltransferase [Vibrio mimicus]